MLGSIISGSVIGLAPFLLANIIEPMLRTGASPVPTKRRGIYLNPYDAFVKKSCFLAFLAVPLCMLFMFFSPGIVIFCLGTSYEPLVGPLRIMLIAASFGSIATVSVTHLATLPAQPPTQVRLQFFIALLKINLVLILSARWGITGAAIASTLAQILSACHSILFCRHILRKHELRL
jgi:O-antigen/teichoic acid export membrane protein